MGNQIYQTMSYLSNEELERWYFRYKTEAEPHGTAMERFCEIHKISYKALDNWRRQTKNKIVPVMVTGMPDTEFGSSDPIQSQDTASLDTPEDAADRCRQLRFQSCRHRMKPEMSHENIAEYISPRILVTIKASNGLYVSRGNLDYKGLLLLVQKLEGLC